MDHADRVQVGRDLSVPRHPEVFVAGDLAAHVFYLIGFRKRFVVLVNWAWAYWPYQCYARVVSGATDNAVLPPR